MGERVVSCQATRNRLIALAHAHARTAPRERPPPRCCCPSLHPTPHRTPQVRHLVVAGGVAANQVVRERLGAVAHGAGLELVAPPPHLCTDNGVMVAWAGQERCARP